MSDDYDEYYEDQYDDQQYEEQQAGEEEEEGFLFFGIFSGFFNWLFK